MNKLKEIIDYYFNIIATLLLIFLICGVVVLLYKNYKLDNVNGSNLKTLAYEGKTIIDNTIKEKSPTDKIKVDIKGAIKKPGVYEIDNNSNVSDLIKIAGGLTNNATTSNLNLSRLLEDQMVVKVSTKNNLKKAINQDITECVCPEIEITKCDENPIIKVEGDNKNAIITTNSDENQTSINTTTTSENPTTNTSKTEEKNLISINTASKEELMTINGIGESKAIAIIEYRNTNGSFKTIEDIKNVSGIGDSLYDKIKSFITV